MPASRASRARSGPVYALLMAMSLVALVMADDAPATATTTTTTPTSAPAIVRTSGKYSYLGCYNETTGLAGTTGARALDGGIHEVLVGNMTVDGCLSFCGNVAAPYQYAGLEYARECWCARTLNSNSQKFPDSSCDLGCDGNSTEACGGTLKLSIYQLSAAPSKTTAYTAAVLVAGGVLAANMLW